MKILYLHQYFNTPAMPGSTRSFEFAKRLVARGDTVYMVTTNWQGKSSQSISNVSGINVYWAPIGYENKMNFLAKIYSYIGYLWYVIIIGGKLNFDLIIASSTPLTVAIPAIMLKKKKRAKLVFEIRDLWPQLPIAIGAIKSSILIKAAQFLERITYENSDQVIALSSGMESELKGVIPNNKLSVITNLSDIDQFQVSDQKGVAFRDNYSGLLNSPLVVYTGSFGRINGVAYLIKIAREMKKINSNVRFILAGDGYEKGKMEKLAEQYGILNKYLFIIDYVPKDKIPNLLSAATVTTSFFIDLPEMEHNSANKFFDGLAAGKPIMINYGGWQAKLLQETGAGFIIPPNDPLIAANQLNDMLSDKEMLNNMSRASFKLAKHYDINTNYKKFEKVIDCAYNS